MDQEIKERWVAALRSGDYPQARSKLNDGTGFCCLGVLCEIAEQDQVVIRKQRFPRDHVEYVSKVDPEDYEIAILPKAVAEWSELKQNPVIYAPLSFFSEDEVRELWQSTLDRVVGDTVRVTLAELNDHYRFDFNKIADIIEASI